MQLIDLRFVDPGNPIEKVGPRFRIFFRNSSPAISLPFDMVLAGGIDRQLKAGLPQAVERVSALQPGQTIGVDVRLPIEAMAMAYPGEDRPAPFSMLFVLIAGQQDLLGGARMKTLAVVPRIGIQSVELAIIKPANPVAPAGATITLRGEGFGLQTGQVGLILPGLKLVAQVVNWGPLGIQVKLPELALAAPTAGKLLVLRTDGAKAVLELQIVPPQAVAAPVQGVAIPAQGPRNFEIPAQAVKAPLANGVITPGPTALQQAAPQQSLFAPQGNAAPQGVGPLAPRNLGQPAPQNGLSQPQAAPKANTSASTPIFTNALSF